MGQSEPDIEPDGFEEEAGIFDFEDEAALAAALAEADGDVAAGRVISHEAMVRWFRSWGTDNPLPPPKCGE